MKERIFIVMSIIMLVFVGCGSSKSSDEAKELLKHNLQLVGIPAEIVVNICQDKNDNGACDVGELQAKVTINENDTVAQMWEKVEFDELGRYILENYDPTLSIIMEIEDKENLKYDDGKLSLKYNPDTEELSVLQALIDSDLLKEEDTTALKALDNREEIDKVLLDSLRVNQNLLKDENLSTKNALSLNLGEIARGLIELNVSKELPEQLDACKDDSGCIQEIIENTSEQVELTKEEAEELARSKNIVDAYIIKLLKPVEAICANGKTYQSSLDVGQEGKINFEAFPVGTECNITVPSGATIDSNNNGILDNDDKLLSFDMIGSADATHITPLTTLLYKKSLTEESTLRFAEMIQNFDPVTAPNRVITNSGVEKVKIEKLIILMEVLKTSMRQFADISQIDLSDIIQTDSNDTIDDLNIDTLIAKLPSEIKDSVRKRALESKKIIEMLKDLDPTKVSLNDFFVAFSDGGKGIEEALNQSLLVPLPKGVSLLDFIIKPTFDDNEADAPSQETIDTIKDSIKVDIESINSTPIADAGEDQNITQEESVTLDGSKSIDIDGTIESYEWWSNEKLLDTRASITLNDLSVGTHVISLVVIDNNGAIGSDTVLVTITTKEIPVEDGNTTDRNVTVPIDDGNATDENTTTINEAPIANAGVDQNITVGASVILDGTASYDTDGTIATYQWYSTSGTEELLSSDSSFTLNNLSLGVHSIVLQVTDNEGIMASDVIVITVVESSALLVANSDYFITTWKTDNNGTSNSNQISIPTNSNYTYNYSIDWGDNSSDSNVTGDINHTYSSIGTYTVKIYGEFPTIYFHDNFDTDIISDAQKVLSIEQWGTIEWYSMNSAFQGCSNMIGNYSDKPDLSNVYSLQAMFSQASTFNQNIGDWNTSNITDMNYMFSGATSFNQDISDWNTSNVRDMGTMFQSAKSFNQNIGTWDVSNVTNMFAMFYKAENFNQDISNWDVSNVTNMSTMFSEALTFNQNIGNWDVSNVRDMGEIFYKAGNFNQNLSQWNVSSVTNMYLIFYGVTLSTQNYDSLLISWSGQALQNNITFNGGNSQYSNASVSARQTLIDTFGWTITDGGQGILSKLFVNAQENNTSFGAELAVGTPLYDVNLTFSPIVNATRDSKFTTEFHFGGFEDTNDISLCSQNQVVGSMIAKGTIRNGLMIASQFKFTSDANESVILHDSNITFHEGVACTGSAPTIATDGENGDVLDVRINNGVDASGISFSDYDTNTVDIATVIDFSTIGSDINALQTPNGGEVWEYDTNQIISWNSGLIDGTTVDLYILYDDPSNLNEFSSTSIELLNSKNWYQFESNLSNIGSFSLNPRDLNGTGDAYIILIIDSNGAWDISNNTFTLVNNTVTYTLKKTGQTQSYDENGTEVLDNSLKDDGFYQKGADVNYTRDNANEIVTDNVTGLMWQDDSNVSSVQKQWVTQASYDAGDYNNTSGDTATTYCNDLNLSGYSDWRLPTRTELQGIADYGRTNPAINPTFINTNSNYYWSSTTNASTNDDAWIIYFYYGSQGYYAKDNYSYIRCVRGGQ